MKLVIVGGVAGGATAATRARRLSEGAEIVVFERGPDVSYSNCGLPYYVGGEIDDRADLLVTTPEQLRATYRLDVRVGSEVVAIDRAARSVRVREAAGGRESDEPFDKLILAMGAAPVRPDVPGADLPGVLTLRDLGDVDRIKAQVDAGVGQALVVGGGYIGLELAEALVHRGVRTTLVQSRDQVLTNFDPEMTTSIADHLVERGVELILDDPATRFEADGAGYRVALGSGRTVRADLVVLGVGVRPEVGLARAAGLAIGALGGIAVDEHLRTSDGDIYAVGDAIEVADFVLDVPASIPLAGPANRQARVAVDHLLGRADARYRGSQGSMIVQVFDRFAAMTGASEASLRRLGRPHRKVYVHGNNHAGYYPGAEPLTLKVLFDPETGRVLGGQAVGGQGVDKRIDGIALAIQGGFTVADLREADLAYAPPVGAANDLINLAGSAAVGLMEGEHPQVDAEVLLEAHDRPDARPTVVDVRSPDDFARGHLPGARNIPLATLRDRLDDLPRDRDVVACCKSGSRSYVAVRILLQAGFRAASLGGGLLTWQAHRGPIESGTGG